MQALSLREPWAWLMLRPDLTDALRKDAAAAGILKQVENRPWNTHKRETVLVHASSTMTRRDYESTRRFARNNFGIVVPEREELQLGGIVGQFEIHDVVNSSKDPWFFGPFGILVRNAKPLPFRACKARQRWFTPEYLEP